MLNCLKNNLVNGTSDPAEEKLYQKYFTIHETPARGKTYSFKEDAIRKAEKNYGYFALMSWITLNTICGLEKLIIYLR